MNSALVNDLVRRYEQEFEETGTPAGYLQRPKFDPPPKPCAPSCHGTESLLAYLSSENIKDEMAGCSRLQDVARLHISLGKGKRTDDEGLEWDKEAWCEPIKQGLAVVVARYVHRRLSSDPEVPRRLRLPGPEGPSPFEYGKTIAMGNLFKFTLERNIGKKGNTTNNDGTSEHLPEHLAYIRHDLEVIRPKVILLFGSTRSDPREKKLRQLLEAHALAPPIIAVYQPQRFVNSNYMKSTYDGAGRAAVNEFEELKMWMRGVKYYKNTGHRLLGQAKCEVDAIIEKCR